MATMEEGVALRSADIRDPILVMGALSEADCAQCVQFDLSACVFLKEQVHAMQTAAAGLGKKAKAHLKIDSGFHRIGVYGESLDAILDAFETCDRVLMEGHFHALCDGGYGGRFV